MAVLTNADRAAIWRGAMEELSQARAPVGIAKADLLAAIAAADAWIDGNSAAFNLALPQPARGALTARQKARLLAYVIQRRYEVS